jgi:aspartokinase
MNVGTGMVSVSGYGGPGEETSFFFMARNVGMMGRMFPSSNDSPTINETVMMSYAGGQRLTDHFATSISQNGTTVNSDFYFDQATGTMVEWRQQTIQTGSAVLTNSTQMMKITSSSIWVVPEFPTFFVPAFAIVMFSSLAVSVIVKFKKNHQHIRFFNQSRSKVLLR